MSFSTIILSCNFKVIKVCSVRVRISQSGDVLISCAFGVLIVIDFLWVMAIHPSKKQINRRYACTCFYTVHNKDMFIIHIFE
ncbi:hypothetical protein [Francisella sp. SYW-9]|uniref:hypothetical protein n=1 Tax=Francisella sp. SYW-9 TaxID=2610888 RepID=UPI00123D5281|nr:hypothetical protein [Francisella sp. SYW-9]